MDFTKNREFFFSVTVPKLEFSPREFQIQFNSIWADFLRSLQGRIFHSWRETNHVAKDQWRLPRRDYLTGVNFHAVKLRVNTFSRRET